MPCLALPCLAYLGPLAKPVAGRSLLVCWSPVARLLVARLLVARYSLPFSLARCSDEVGGFSAR